MNPITYTKKLFVADLVITSIWALFAAKSTPEIESWELVAILMRIVLCFRMYAKSDWMGYSAIIFAGAYLILPNHFTFGFQHAVTGIMYHTLHIIDWDTANDVFLHPDRIGFTVAYYVLWSLLSLWLVIMPLAVSIRNGKLFRFPKWCWPIIVLFIAHVIFGVQGFVSTWYYASAACFVAVCLVPDIYWVAVNGRKQSLVDVLTANRALVFYVAFVGLFLSSFVIGFRNVYMLEFIGLVTFPPVLYVLLAKAIGVRHIPTYDTVLMSVCGIVYWYCPELSQTPRVVALAVAVLICLVISVRLAHKSSDRLAGVSLFIGTTVIVCPLLSGMNPYVVTDATHTRLYMKKRGAYNGLYVTDNHDGVCGLRGRYGEILPMKYSSIDVLEDSDDNILCCKERVYDKESDGNYREKYTFFNINSREFIQIPGNISIAKIIPVRKGVYKLYDNTDTPLFYLVMPFTEDIGYYHSGVQVLKCSDYAIGDAGIPTELPDDAIKLESPDGKLKFYSWNTGMGGTSPDYASYIEYYDGNGMVTDFFAPLSSSEYVCGKDLSGMAVSFYEGSAILDLWQVTLSGEKNVYIVTATNKSSSAEGETSVFVLGYVDGKIVKKPVARADCGNTYSIGTLYYIPDWYFTTDGLGWDWLISFDKETNTLYVASETEDMLLNDRYDKYRFEKGMLSYVGTDAGYWLHSSLHDFKKLCGIYQTDNKLIRIDQLNDGTYRYAAWDKSKGMSDAPELILSDGQAGIVENAIVFRNGDYTYIVPEYRRGHGDDFGKVIIKHKDMVIQETDV